MFFVTNRGDTTCFRFNTSFIPGDNLRLLLKREELDNPHKPKVWNVFREKFQIEVVFVRA